MYPLAGEAEQALVFVGIEIVAFRPTLNVNPGDWTAENERGHEL
jgi:hypothetical protein